MEYKMEDVRNWVHKTVGNNAWEKFHDNTKADLQTAVAFYWTFESSDDAIDYASSIIPIMKSLEYELRIQFYDPYLKYLKTHYTPEQYANEILQENDKDDFAQAAELKWMVIRDNGGLAFVEAENNNIYTLGNFIYTVSNGNRNETRIDRPFLNYCRECLFEGYEISNNKIRTWIHSIILGVRTQQKVRNESAHGGSVQNKMDATKVMEEVVSVEKLLASIKHPSFLK